MMKTPLLIYIPDFYRHFFQSKFDGKLLYDTRMTFAWKSAYDMVHMYLFVAPYGHLLSLKYTSFYILGSKV